MNLCIYVFIYSFVYIAMNLCIYIFIDLYSYESMYLCMYIFIYLYSYECMYVCIYSFIYIVMNLWIYVFKLFSVLIAHIYISNRSEYIFVNGVVWIRLIQFLMFSFECLHFVLRSVLKASI